MRDPDGVIRGWASAHDRAAGRMLLVVRRRPRLDDGRRPGRRRAVRWADGAARGGRGPRGSTCSRSTAAPSPTTSGSTGGWQRAGFEQVRTWWQMTRPVDAAEAAWTPERWRRACAIRLVRASRAPGCPTRTTCATVHDILESAFADHFNSHEETFDEFVYRLREDPGHRWDHWWIAELVDGGEPEPAGALVGAVSEGSAGPPGRQLRGVHRRARRPPGAAGWPSPCSAP